MNPFLRAHQSFFQVELFEPANTKVQMRSHATGLVGMLHGRQRNVVRKDGAFVKNVKASILCFILLKSEPLKYESKGCKSFAFRSVCSKSQPQS